MLYFIVFTVLIPLIDQFFKFNIRNNIPESGQLDTVIPFLKLTNIRNTGGALGVFKAYPFIMSCVVITIIMFFCYLIFVKKVQDKLFLVSACFIVGGGVSNLIDRIWLGYVIDYLSVSFFPPVCNLSDYFIFVGTILLVIYYFILDKKLKNVRV